MALSSQEKVRRHRERKKAQEAKASVQLADIYRIPFNEFFEPNRVGSDFDVALLLAGIETPKFEDDKGAREHTAYPDPESLDGMGVFEVATNSLGRAEFIIETLATAAEGLAGWVNGYKKEEIKQRLQEIEERDLSDPEAKRAAMQEATRLNKMLDQLDKQVRITLPQWKVTG